ncbi:hypothetical protein ACFE04_021893 [Oxalis oulophora]
MGCIKMQSEIEKHNAVDGIFFNKTTLPYILNSEIAAVLAVMRRNVRWGARYMSEDDQIEHSLIQNLKVLRKQIFFWQNPCHDISPSIYLQPFLDVIRSDETGAPITSVALSSVYKILTIDVIDQKTINAKNAMHSVVDAVSSCRFEVTDPASEEVVLMKILQVFLACIKSKASVVLSNQHVCNIVTTCFRIVHQASTKGELLQRIARQTMHELVRCIFSRLSGVEDSKDALVNGVTTVAQEIDGPDNECVIGGKQLENGNLSSEKDGQSQPSDASPESGTSVAEENTVDDVPYGIPCMVEIFHFLCSLLNVAEHASTGRRSNTIAFDEDVPLFALSLINSAIELGGPSFHQHPSLLNIIQDELFHNLMQFGLSMSPLILSMVCNIVLNLYHHLRTQLKLQLEAFFSCVVLRLAQSKYGASYQQQEVAMEALVDFCRQKSFMVEMYANLDCDISCGNVFEDLTSLLSKSAFPVNSPLSSMHILALDGLIAIIQGMAERIDSGSVNLDQVSVKFEEYSPFWKTACENYSDPASWVPFMLQKKYIKTKLFIGADHFNQDPKKGLEFLQGSHLLPDKLDPQSVACFLRYTTGLDKNLVGDYLGNHDDFCIQVLHEFARTFDFQDMNLDMALRLFLEAFRLPGEAQKIHRVLEAFSERYYEQSPEILVDKDAALVLSYSLILLNTDQHNVQVKKKMTEDDFIRNNRQINGGGDLPRDFLSELYHSICKNEIRTTPEQSAGLAEMTSSRWISLMYKSKKNSPFVLFDCGPHLDKDMFAIMSGPAIAAISVVFDNAEHDDVYKSCIDGFLAVAKISASYHLQNVLDDLVVSLCKFTTLLDLDPASVDEAVLAFSDDPKAMMATETLFSIANKYGDNIRSGWRNILDCILQLHKLGLLPASVDSAEESEKPVPKSQSSSNLTSSMGITSRKSSGLMGRFSQLLYYDTEETVLQPTDEQLAAQQISRQTIEKCNVDSIFTESKFLQAESLLPLVRALISAAGRPQKGNSFVEDEDDAVFCLELLIRITLNNRDRIALLWEGIHEHIANIVQSTVIPCALVEKAVFGLLRICQRLLPYKENVADELLRSLQLVLKLDARVADAYCEQITQEVTRLVKTNAPQIRSQIGWRTIITLLSITARHPEASETGFDALVFIMTNGAHLLPANYVLCVDASRQFAESRLGETERSVHSLDLMAGSITCLARWANEAKSTMTDGDMVKMSQNIGEMWLRLVQGLRKVCVDQRFEVRNHAILSLQKCLAGADEISLPRDFWLQCFEPVIFSMLDDLQEIAQVRSQKEYRNMEATLILALKLTSKVFLQFLRDLSQLTEFHDLWLGVLTRMENYMKLKIRGKKSYELQEMVPELLKNTLIVMKAWGVLVKSDSGKDSTWESTWVHVNKIDQTLQSEVFPDQVDEQPELKQDETGSSKVSGSVGLAIHYSNTVIGATGWEGGPVKSSPLKIWTGFTMLR